MPFLFSAGGSFSVSGTAIPRETYLSGFKGFITDFSEIFSLRNNSITS